MKKVIAVLLIAVLICALSASLFGCSNEDRSKILKIYMPADYMDEDLLADFEAWYQEETGNKVTVQIDTFEAVEDIQRVVEQGKADYDLLCPSDYMVEYLLKKNLLKKVDKDIIDVEESGLFKEAYLTTSREFDPTLEYSVPYMYGTLGLVYDYRKTNAHVNSWDALFGNHSYNVSVKDSMRDAYVAACLYNARGTLTGLTGQDQKDAVQAVFLDTTDATLRAAKETLTSITYKWDIDDVKFEMAANQSNVAVALMWSCDAGYVMNDYEDANGVMQSGNRNLWYVVPEEGGNVYIDCFVISKYAKNTQAANYFLQFLCEKDTAVANSEYAGAISPVAAAYDELYEMYELDEDGMFDGVSSEWKEMFMETMFPSVTTLNRCGVMKDFGSRQSIIARTWEVIHVK
ncbi:MAG TPA: hypothetical protein DHV31_02305 [Clostridiales bacterium]|nr:hypothetical protein [Clostridiales bacterium]